MIRSIGFLMILVIAFSCNQRIELPPDIVPKPQQLTINAGIFRFTSSTTIFVENNAINTVNLQGLIKKLHGFTVPISVQKQSNQIRVKVDSSLNHSDDYYQLDATGDVISIISKTKTGAFYGTQSLLQSIRMEKDFYMVPRMSIVDSSRFTHRGLLLDCSRHFFSVDVVKKYIDLLALFKMNVLHWHLTDDQGWRIEIEKYPKLAEISAWRKEADGSTYGGYYTKQQIRDVVAYAAERHVTIIPEIELPGHAQAALAAYPEFSCVGGDLTVANDWGVFKEIYCAGNEGTFTFLENVLTEVMELFPSEYIHIGGDEAPKFRWEQCPKCQARIKNEGLTDAHELQSYFIQRIEKFLNANGRKLIGWDEIMEGGLSPTATVQAWRGMDHGMEAAAHGNPVVFSPTSHSYLDYDLKSIDLAKVYSLELIPEKLEPKYTKNIRGAEVNMWTEHVPNEAVLDQKVFPRLLALAEVSWTYDTTRNFDEFLSRVLTMYPLLEKLGVQYGAESVPVTLRSEVSDIARIELKPGIPGLKLKYQINDGNWINYEKSITIDFSGNLKVQAFRNDQPYGESITQPVTSHKGLAKALTLENAFSDSYTGGGSNGLVDGLLGTLDFRDGCWQGYFGEHLEAVLDLGRPMDFQSISINAYQYNNAWIFLPKNLTVELSTDGENWTTMGKAFPKAAPEQRGQFIESLEVKTQQTVTARYIRLMAENLLTVPDWHEAAGSKAWLFVDEIVIN